MNNLAVLILFGMLTGVAAPAPAIEPARGGPSPGGGSSAGIVQSQAAPTPGSQSNVMADPAQQVEPQTTAATMCSTARATAATAR